MAKKLKWYHNERWQLGGLILFSCLIYANTLGHDFALDDAITITDNEFVQEGFGGIGDIFRYDTFRGFFGEAGKENLVAGGRYRPLTLAMFAVEGEVNSSATWYHLLNVLWYAGLVAVIFLFVRDLARAYEPSPWWLAAGVALLFAAHPLHTEAVANVKGRDEIVALLGAVAAVWCCWRAAEWEQFLGAAAGAGLLLLGCLAKENAITFLAVAPVCLLLFRERGAKGGKRLLYALPLVVAVGIFLLLRTSVIGFSLGDPVREVLNNPFLEYTATGQWVDLSTGNRLATVMHTLWAYLRLLFAPYGLVHDYYPRAVPIMGWGDGTPWLGLLLHVGLAVFALLKWRTHRFSALGILVYLASLSIVSNVFFSVGTNMSERFLFMPSLGWALAVTGILARLQGKWGYVIPAVAVVFGLLTVLRNPAWQDNFTLFTTDVKKQPNSAKLSNAAGAVRLDFFQTLTPAQQAANQGLLRDALVDLDRAIKIHPTYKNAFLARGGVHFFLKNYDAAIADYDRALDIDGGYQEASNNLVLVLTTAGRVAGEEKRDLPTAFRYLRRAEQLAPNDYEVLRLLGIASGISGQLDQALSYLQRAAAAQPNNADALWNYGTALYNAGRAEEAEAQFAAAERLKPGIRAQRER
ncbi:MAG: tetratricopeptide repeat protein [Bacteroidota bacterium]